MNITRSYKINNSSYGINNKSNSIKGNKQDILSQIDNLQELIQEIQNNLNNNTSNSKVGQLNTNRHIIGSANVTKSTSLAIIAACVKLLPKVCIKENDRNLNLKDLPIILKSVFSYISDKQIKDIVHYARNIKLTSNNTNSAESGDYILTIDDYKIETKTLLVDDDTKEILIKNMVSTLNIHGLNVDFKTWENLIGSSYLKNDNLAEVAKDRFKEVLEAEKTYKGFQKNIQDKSRVDKVNELCNHLKSKQFYDKKVTFKDEETDKNVRFTIETTMQQQSNTNPIAIAKCTQQELEDKNIQRNNPINFYTTKMQLNIDNSKYVVKINSSGMVGTALPLASNEEEKKQIMNGRAEQIISSLTQDTGKDSSKKHVIVNTKLLRDGNENKIKAQHFESMTNMANELSKSDANPQGDVNFQKSTVSYFGYSVNTHANWKKMPFSSSKNLSPEVKVELNHNLQSVSLSEKDIANFGHLKVYLQQINKMKNLEKDFCLTMLIDLIYLLKDAHKRRHAIPVATLESLLVMFLNDKSNYNDESSCDTVFHNLIDCKSAKDRTTAVLAGVEILAAIMLDRFVKYQKTQLSRKSDASSNDTFDTNIIDENVSNIGRYNTNLSLRSSLLDKNDYLDVAKLDDFEKQLISGIFDQRMFTVGNDNMYGVHTNISYDVFDSSFFKNIKWLNNATDRFTTKVSS